MVTEHRGHVILIGGRTTYGIVRIQAGRGSSRAVRVHRTVEDLETLKSLAVTNPSSRGYVVRLCRRGEDGVWQTEQPLRRLRLSPLESAWWRLEPDEINLNQPVLLIAPRGSHPTLYGTAEGTPAMVMV